jgi:sulfur carrier protein ThiS adenylyltransferase
MFGMTENVFNFTSVLQSFLTDVQIEAVKKVKIGIAGAGGLGSNCIHALVRCGFEKFVVVDFDIVSVSNLNRQLYFPEQVGLPKVESLKKMLKQLNSDLEIHTFQERITNKNVSGYFDDCDCIVEAFDNPESKALLVNAFIGSKKLLVSVSGIGGYGKSDRIVTRKIRSNFFMVGDGISEVGALVKPFAPCVMIAAAKQADIVLDWVLSR